jgi:hypothetical protein
MLIECINCKLPFDCQGATRYCSEKCKKEYRTKTLGYQPGAKDCPVCGNIFTPKRADGKYCSPKCAYRAKYLSNNPIKNKKCLSCDKVFSTTSNKKIYCSVKCMRHHEYLINIDKFKQKRKEQYRANPELAKAKTKQWRDDNRNKYLEMQNDYHDRVRFSGNKQLVLERDGYKCVTCGASEGLNVHHKDRTGQLLQRNDDIDNLITQCNSCHMVEHHTEINPHPKNRVEVKCKRCGKAIEIIPSRIGRTKYCSKQCRFDRK